MSEKIQYFLSIINKLYLSFSVIIIILVSFISYDDTINRTMKNNESYRKANSYYDQIRSDIQKNGFSPDLYLAKQRADIFKFNPCFNYDGEITNLYKVDDITGETCKNIKEFERKEITMSIFEMILRISLTIIILILIKNWCKWIFQKVN